MSPKKPPKNSKNKGLKAKDVALWKHMTADVERIKGAEYLEMGALDDIEDVGLDQHMTTPVASMPTVPVKIGENAKLGQGLDGRTEARLRKGQIRPEAQFDLHGMGQAEAYEALRGFITGCAARGMRCVLVITGKGKTGMLSDAVDWFAPKRGVLKTRVPEWLSEPAFVRYVAYYTQAQPRDGGGGALYVYLRR